MIGIVAIAPVLPSAVVPVATLPERALLPEAERAAFDGLGIDTVGDDPASGPELAAAAGARALETAGVEPGEVDALIVVEGRVPEKLMASEATRVQAAVGAARAVTFGVGGLGCVSISAALLAARSLLAGNPAWQHVLVTHGSKPPAPRRYRHPVTINGDGAVAVVVGRDAPSLLLGLELETDGEYWDLFGVEYRDRPQAEWVEECRDQRTYSFKLAVESRNRFRTINERVLDAAGIAPQDVSHHVMQNLSEAAFRFYEEMLGVTFARACRANLRRYGHLGSMDVVLNLHTGLETGEFAAGDTVLVMNNSPVAAWSSMLVAL